jgi:hypothetical protein
MTSTRSEVSVCELYQLKIYMNKCKSAIKTGIVIQRMQVDLRSVRYVRRRIDSTLHHH